MKRILLLAIVLAGLSIGCDDHDAPIYPTSPTPTADRVEFRVDGADLSGVIIRVSNSIDGLTQITSVLPYTSSITLTGRDPVFLSLEARAPLQFGFLHVGIFVNGIIFREASSANIVSPVVSVSGTFRR